MAHELRYYMRLIIFVFTGPTVLCAYIFTIWGLAADMGLTNSFPWSIGPLSNWMIWLALALLLTWLRQQTAQIRD